MPAAVAPAESGLLTGLASLDGVDLQDTFLHQRVLTLQGVPARLRGALRTALRAGLQLIADSAGAAGLEAFIFLAPRMLCQRSDGDSLIPPAELDRRCDLFARGAWPQRRGAGCSCKGGRLGCERRAVMAVSLRKKVGEGGGAAGAEEACLPRPRQRLPRRPRAACGSGTLRGGGEALLHPSCSIGMCGLDGGGELRWWLRWR